MKGPVHSNQPSVEHLKGDRVTLPQVDLKFSWPMFVGDATRRDASQMVVDQLADRDSSFRISASSSRRKFLSQLHFVIFC